MSSNRRTFSRREFLKVTGIGGTAALLAACGAPSAGTGTGAAATTTAGDGPAAAPAADTTATITIFDFGGEADNTI